MQLFNLAKTKFVGSRKDTAQTIASGTYHFTVLEVDFLALFGQFLLAKSSHFNRNPQDCECDVRVEDLPTHILHRVQVGHTNLTKATFFLPTKLA